ncbi:MAG: hypothetical protein ACK56F_24575, partial [bacterium]
MSAPQSLHTGGITAPRGYSCRQRRQRMSMPTRLPTSATTSSTTPASSEAELATIRISIRRGVRFMRDDLQRALCRAHVPRARHVPSGAWHCPARARHHPRCLA